MTTDLYRYFDAEGRLLYVGISFHAAARASQHRADKAWWPDVANMTVEHLPTRGAAVVAEMTAIRLEGPMYNIVGKGKHERSAAAPWRCELCRRGFGITKEDGYIQVDRDDEWHAVCRTCDDDGRAGYGAYWIDAKRVKTIADIEHWTEHLCDKNWFDQSSWTYMIKRHCTIPNAHIDAYLAFDAWRDRRNRASARTARTA